MLLRVKGRDSDVLRSRCGLWTGRRRRHTRRQRVFGVMPPVRPPSHARTPPHDDAGRIEELATDPEQARDPPTNDQQGSDAQDHADQKVNHWLSVSGFLSLRVRAEGSARSRRDKVRSTIIH